MADTIKGVKNAIRKFHNQLLAVDSAPCFALVLVGKVSPIRIQIPGAHVVAYPRMNRHALTIITVGLTPKTHVEG